MAIWAKHGELLLPSLLRSRGQTERTRRSTGHRELKQ